MTLKSENILITGGGRLTVGTEEEPFQHQATIELHGQLRAKELPIYGAKCLAIREGTLNLHGKWSLEGGTLFIISSSKSWLTKMPDTIGNVKRSA